MKQEVDSEAFETLQLFENCLFVGVIIRIA
jgi:hypothetical protein